MNMSMNLIQSGTGTYMVLGIIISIIIIIIIIPKFQNGNFKKN